MSRIAKKPIVLPDGVKVSVEKGKIVVEGKLGKLEQTYKSEFIDVKVENGAIMVNRKGDAKEYKALQGLYYRLFVNMVKGVTEGFSKTLLLQGIGYKMELKGNKLVLTVGFSHAVEFEIPKGISLKLENPQTLIVSGIDKHLVGQTAANIRAIKPPEPYKGKGLRYLNERVKVKEGKTAK
ncbi:MAG: 50S ribosomal protein L6 [Brevinematales bacterium]|nr:50S ribosomal protein L6 [Brevinematales bacterium]